MKSIFLLTRNTINSRWMVVPAGFFIMSVSGAIYAFGVYSGAMKTALGYNQKTLTTIGFFKDFGNIGIFAGIIADLFPAWVVLTVGVAFNTCGYLMIWLAVTKKIAKPALWQMYLYITIGGNSVAFTHAGALVTCVKNFPLHRGMIVGLLKGFLGLSTAILTLIYRAIYGDHPSSFILLITYLPLVVIFVFMFFIRPIPLPSDEGRIEDEAKVFYRLLGFEVSVAAYLMVVILIQHEVGVKKVVNGVFAGALAIMMFVPVGLVAWMEYQKLRTNRTAADVETNVKQLSGGEEVNNGLAKVQPKDSPDETTEEEEEPVKETNTENNPKKSLVWRLRDALRTPAVGRDFTVWQALVHPYFWILSAASTGGLGAGLMLIDNLGQVGAAYGYDREKTGTFVSLISIWNCLGRVGVGFLSEFFLQKYGLARPFFFAVALAFSALGYLAIGLNWPGALFFGSILIGLCFGAQWSLLHIIVSEIFGLKYYGTLQSIIAMASPLGTYLLSVRVAGYMYDKEADRQRASGHISGQDVACHGTVCYKKSLLIMCGVCTAGCLLTLVMTWHSQRFYKREVYERLKAKRIEMVKAKQEEAARLNGK